MNEAEKLATRIGAITLAEDWPKSYKQSPEQFATLMTQTSKLNVLLIRFFKEMAKKSDEFFNHWQYMAQVKLDVDVSVIVNDDQVDTWDSNFVKITFQTVNTIVVAGVKAAEVVTKIPFGIPSTSQEIQNVTTEQVASLVGKKVIYNADGGVKEVVDNPNAAYNVIETVRKDIVASVKTSLMLGETTDEAVIRMKEVISDPSRARLIAQTESVNAYQAGKQAFAMTSGAIGKEWMSSGSSDICSTYAGIGPVAISYQYGAAGFGPTAHPNCRCDLRLIYAEEAARTGIDFSE
jgi:hypothetical protein